MRIWRRQPSEHPTGIQQYLPQSPSHHVSVPTHTTELQESRRSGDMVSLPTTRTRSKIANSPLGNWSARYFSLCSRTVEISETADSAEHSTAVNAVTNGQCAIELERVTKTGNIGHVRHEFLPGRRALHSPDSRRTPRRPRSRTRKISPVARSLAAICLIGTWPRTLSICRVALIPANPAEQDDVTAVIVGHNLARELVATRVEGWIFRTQVPI